MRENLQFLLARKVNLISNIIIYLIYLRLSLIQVYLHVRLNQYFDNNIIFHKLKL